MFSLISVSLFLFQQYFVFMYITLREQEGGVLRISSNGMPAQPTKGKALHLHVILKVERYMYICTLYLEIVIFLSSDHLEAHLYKCCFQRAFR